MSSISSRASASSSTIITLQPASAARVARRRERRVAGGLRRLLAHRRDAGRLHGEGRALPGPSLSARTLPAVQLHQFLDDRQAQPEARRAGACWSCRPGGSARTRAAGSRGDALPGVAHRDLDAGRARRTLHRHHAAAAGELDRVRQQVPQHLLQAVRVHAHAPVPGSMSFSSGCRAPPRPRARCRAPPRSCRRGRPAHVQRTLPEMIRLMSSRSSTMLVLRARVALDHLGACSTLPVARCCAAGSAPSPGSASSACAARARAWRGTRP
jgi:hypothetical protein